MRKVHVKMTLDLLVYADDNADIVNRLSEADIQIESDDETVDIQDINILNVEVTDSR